LFQENIHQFYKCHSNRQGIATLAFTITSGTIDDLYQRYLTLHPKLLVEDYADGVQSYEEGNGSTIVCKVLEVYSYYKDDKGGDVDKGTKLRFIQRLDVNDGHDEGGDMMNDDNHYHCLPGILPIDATFDETCMSAYCDHWVSNGKYLSSLTNM
jgi:hypothetical protein